MALAVILFLISILGFGIVVAGLIKPKWVKQKDRKDVLKYFLSGSVLIFVISLILVPTTPTDDTDTPKIDISENIQKTIIAIDTPTAHIKKETIEVTRVVEVTRIVEVPVTVTYTPSPSPTSTFTYTPTPSFTPSVTLEPSETIPPSNTHLPSNTPKPTNTQSPEKEVREIVEDILGDGNRDVKKIDYIHILEDGSITIKFAIDDSPIASWLITETQLDITEVAKELCKARYCDGLAMIGTFSMVDIYGNISENIVVSVYLSKSTLSLINWNNFSYRDIYNIADELFLHPDFRP